VGRLVGSGAMVSLAVAWTKNVVAGETKTGVNGAAVRRWQRRAARRNKSATRTSRGETQSGMMSSTMGLKSTSSWERYDQRNRSQNLGILRGDEVGGLAKACIRYSALWLGTTGAAKGLVGVGVSERAFWGAPMGTPHEKQGAEVMRAARMRAVSRGDLTILDIGWKGFFFFSLK
jgi:hypothetical protein